MTIANAENGIMSHALNKNGKFQPGIQNGFAVNKVMKEIEQIEQMPIDQISFFLFVPLRIVFHNCKLRSGQGSGLGMGSEVSKI